MEKRRHLWSMFLGVSGLIAAVFAAFSPAFRAGFVWDDLDAISGNLLNQSLAGLGKIWSSPKDIPQGHYWPITFTGFWLQYQLWGARPLGYHVVNLVLHSTNAVVLWMLLRRLRFPGAWLAAALFAVHPMQVESVVWAVELKNVLSGLFALMTVHAYLSFLGHRSWKWVLAVLLLFACAMLSKTLAVSVPLALVLIHIWKREPLDRWAWGTLGGLAFIAICLVLLDVRFYLVGEESKYSLAERLVIAGRCVWFFVGKLLWPYPIMTVYPRWDVDAGRVVQWIPFVAVPLLLIILFYHRTLRSLGLACAFFVGALLPILNIVDQPYFSKIAFVTNHGVYYACVGLFLPLAVLAARFWGHPRRSARSLGRLAIVLVLLGLGCISWHESRFYKDLETLFQRAVDQNPESAVAHYNLARTLLERGQLQKATHHYSEAVRLQPADAKGHLGLGSCYALQEDLAGAEREWKKADQLDPGLPDSLVNLAWLAHRRGDTSRVLELASEAVRRNPNDAVARARHADALLEAEHFPEAVAAYAQVISSSPDLLEAQKGLKTAISSIGNGTTAVVSLRTASERLPANPDIWLALARAEERDGNTTAALQAMERLLRVKPDNASWHYATAILAKKLKNHSRAASAYEDAIRLQPRMMEALVSLSLLFSSSSDDSLRNGKRALELARMANAESTHPQVLEALAAAYAECGDFENSVQSARRALEEGKALPPEWIRIAEERLKCYEARKPLRQ